MRRFLRSETGASTAEYVLVLTAIAFFLAVSLGSVANLLR
jgi:Flp pilus assembly pilin Flp